eukprot:275247-Pyramimonas_sp.AAC.1
MLVAGDVHAWCDGPHYVAVHRGTHALLPELQIRPFASQAPLGAESNKRPYLANTCATRFEVRNPGHIGKS